MNVKLTHYAFAEGQRAYANGCGLEMNPYYDAEGNVPDHNAIAHGRWKCGWWAAEKAEIMEGYLAKAQQALDVIDTVKADLETFIESEGRGDVNDTYLNELIATLKEV